MRAASRHRQRGLSFVSWVVIGVLAVSVFVIGGQSVPILLEYQGVQRAAQRAAQETGSVGDVRAAFDRSAQIDNITHIRGADLEITKVNDKVVVKYAYEREIPLVGPAYLVYRFNSQTR